MARSKPTKTTDQETAERWLDRIQKRLDDSKSWFEEAERVARRYRNEGELTNQSKDKRGRRFNVLWSNINVLKPALYSRDPKPEVERKHKDKAEVGRLAGQILERACLVCIQDQTFGDSMKMARDDRLLSARGLVWLQYRPTYGAEQPQRIPLTLTESGSYAGAPDGKFRAKGEVLEDDLGPFMAGDTYKPVVAEKVGIEFVHHKDFVHSDAPSWDKVRWAARRVWMTKRQIADRFGGSIAAHIDTKRAEAKQRDDKTPRDTAPIWEICDKDNGEWLWVCPDYKDGPLDVKPDPLKLSSFYPCPRPVYGTLTPDSLIPVPDWVEYADQARELDLLTERAYRLIEGIRVAGVYDANAKGMADLFNTTGDKFVAVNNWAVFAEKGGLKSAMDQLDVKPIADALQIILNVREQVKRDLYEISGISDIMRGDTDAGETLGAQKLKSSFGTSRIKEPKSDMERFVRDTLQIVAEIICEHFSPEQIAEMADATDLLEGLFEPDPNNPDPQAAMQEAQMRAMQAYQEAIKLLKDDGARGYKISIETDSTIELDEQQEKQDRIEFLTAATGFLEKGAAIGLQAPEMKPLLASMLQWGMRAFRVSRDLEQEFEKAIDSMAKADKERAKQPPPPTPEELKAKEAEAKIASDERVRTQEAQIKGQVDAQKTQAAHIEKMRQFELDFAELDAEAARHQRELAHQSQLQDKERTFKGELADKDRDMKREAEAIKASAKSAGGEGESEDDMKIEIKLPPELEQAVAQAAMQQSQARVQEKQANAQASQQLPEVMAQVAQTMGQAAQAMTQVAQTLAMPVEVMKDQKTGRKRAVRVAA